MQADVLVRAEAVDHALSVAPQLHPHDMQRLAEAGFRSIINNRPDFEGGPTQPISAELQEAARAAGLEYRHLPVPPADHTDHQAREMAQLVEALPKPVLAFCRSGRRGAALYAKGKSLRR